jgi:hypothetical protein
MTPNLDFIVYLLDVLIRVGPQLAVNYTPEKQAQAAEQVRQAEEAKRILLR